MNFKPANLHFYGILFEANFSSFAVKIFNMLEIGERPWGKYFVLADETHYKLKRILVEPGQRLSYQYHHKRQEHWTVTAGVATVILDGEERTVGYGESICIPLGAKHRIENRGKEIVEVVEVQTGTYFGEDDIVRIEDDYSRTK